MQLLRYNLLAMSNVDHPNILKIASWAIESQIAFILTEYLPYGDYIERAVFSKSVTEKTVANVVKQILSAIQYAAEKGIYHYDLKPENILVSNHSNNHVLIIDFGLNKFIGPEEYINIKLGEERHGNSVSISSY